MAAHTVHRSQYVRSRLADGCTAVVTARTNGGRSEQAVIRLGAEPGTRGLVATLTHGLTIVDGSSGTAA